MLNKELLLMGKEVTKSVQVEVMTTSYSSAFVTLSLVSEMGDELGIVHTEGEISVIQLPIGPYIYARAPTGSYLAITQHDGLNIKKEQISDTSLKLMILSVGDRPPRLEFDTF